MNAVGGADGPVVPSLATLGVDHVEETVYRALMTNPFGGIADLARLLQMPTSTVEEALDRLADKALLERATDEPGRWTIVNPDLGLGALLAMEEAVVAERWHEVRRLRDHVSELSGTYRGVPQHRSELRIERVASADAVRQRLVMLARETEFEVLSLAPGGPQPGSVMASSRTPDRESLERGVTMRTVYLESIRNSQATSDYARWLVDNGAEVRTAAVLPMRMIIADRSRAVIPLVASDSTKGALLVSDPAIVAVCLALFEQIWQSAALMDAGRSREHAGSAPTPQEKELLKFLGLGHSDEFVARQLGVSLRTVRRMMSSLMRRLNAKSRFQAGMKSAQLGWTDTVS